MTSVWSGTWRARSSTSPVADRRPGEPQQHAERVPDGYQLADAERLVVEGAKSAQRSAFARDRARVVHSSALRRLAGRTQVLGPSADDFVRNRLTHSLEVAQVGRELGQALGCDPDVVDAACLSHDIGHPPFGHDGETALDEVAAGCGGFEANAQTLRILTRLEAKTAHPDGRPAGLNLTRASLDAATKYPWTRGQRLADAPGSPVKFGVYVDDAPVFGWVRAGRGGRVRDGRGGGGDRRRCLEAQVMDFADDVAYSVHDVEDAVVGGALDLAVLGDAGVLAELGRVCRDRYVSDVADVELAAARDGLSGQQWWPPAPYDGSRTALAGLKDVTSRLVGRFTGDALHATRDRLGPGRLTRYAGDLVVPRDTAVTIALLKSLAARFVMDAAEHVARRERQREVLLALCAALAAGPARWLEPPFAADLAAAGDDAARLRVVVDQVASLTDVSALLWHSRLTADRPEKPYRPEPEETR